MVIGDVRLARDIFDVAVYTIMRDTDEISGIATRNLNCTWTRKAGDLYRVGHSRYLCVMTARICPCWLNASVPWEATDNIEVDIDIIGTMCNVRHARLRGYYV